METGDVYNSCLQLKKDISDLIFLYNNKLIPEAQLNVCVVTQETDTACGKMISYKVDVFAIIKPE
jgi:hypothetical protein